MYTFKTFTLFSAIGCPEFKAPRNARVTFKDGIAIITCNSNGITQKNHCIGTAWESLELKCNSGDDG